eukprot:TRINITY_DN29889_c0_g1_i1.p1 TRINITY_DN29889_c0_g1~~TRINITY_DN29889_c0_g1_i1.p1  ORF type:complete len:357 (-),score=57.58 TRINITY_DN29889_c0_g1_i1:34-1104(-)
MDEAKTAGKAAPSPGSRGTEHRHLNDWTQQRSTRHGMSVPQMHQRLDDLSHHVNSIRNSIREEMVLYVRTAVKEVLTSRVAAVEETVHSVDERLLRMEMLLLRSDFESFQAIDNTLMRCKHTFLESEDQAHIAKPGSHLQPTQAAVVLASSASSGCCSSSVATTQPARAAVCSRSNNLKMCGHTGACLCGFWASSEGCVVRVDSKKCDFICPGEEEVSETSDAWSDDDDIPDLQMQADGAFTFHSWQTAGVTPDRVDWVQSNSAETNSWHRLSHRIDGTFKEITSEASVGDIVQIGEPLLPGDTQLEVEVAAGTGGFIEETDRDGHLYIFFPSLEGRSNTRTWVPNEKRPMIRILK